MPTKQIEFLSASAMACSLSLVPRASITCWWGGSTAGPSHYRISQGRQRFRSRRNFFIARKRKLKGGATPLVRARPEASAMRLYDRTADREAQPQAGRLRRVEGLEHPLEHRCLKSRTRILNRNQHAAGFFCCADQQLSRTLVGRSHCFKCIDDQVEQHLLQLNTICFNQG